MEQQLICATADKYLLLMNNRNIRINTGLWVIIQNELFGEKSRIVLWVCDVKFNWYHTCSSHVEAVTLVRFY